MLATVGRDKAIELLNVEHDSVRALIDELSTDEMLMPDTIRYGLYSDQECSFKDLLAHLITYEAYTLEALAAWRQGERHWIIDAMDDYAESKRVHYDGIDCRRPMSLDAVLDEWQRTQSDLMDAIATLTDDEWNQPAPFPTDEATNLGGMFEAILVAPPRPMYRHLPVHIPDSDAYIRSLRG